ncbi:MAG: hypothetical protein ACOY3D_01315 [Candidatus Omnitrophota bacterium]
MSIIYEALKKIKPVFPDTKAAQKEKSLLLYLATAAIFMGFLVSGLAIFLLFSSLAKPVQVIQKDFLPSTPAAPQVNAPPQPSAVNPVLPNIVIPQKPRAAATLDLKGIMDSAGERIALINNEILKEGDYINGARVIRITKNSVELFRKDKIIILKIK